MINTKNGRPNVLWVTSDQQRYDTVHAHGCEVINTPNLDKLAREGVSFMNAYTQCPICTPSRASFMTGRYPASHHVHRNGNDHFPPTEKIISRILKDNGYFTGIIGKHHLSRSEERIELIPEDGYMYSALGDCWPIGRDYDDWLKEEKGIEDPLKLYPDLLQSSPRDYGPGLPLENQQATWWAERAIQFIERDHDSPWFLNLNAVDPHPPFFPPKEFLDKYDPAKMPLPLYRESDVARQEGFWEIDQQWKKIYDVRHYDPAEDIDQSAFALEDRNLFDFPPDVYNARMIRACYYAMIEMIDDRLGMVLNALERTGQIDNTVVIFTSDHGEMLGDHGMLYKGCRFFEGLVHVPLIIRWPAEISPDTRSKALVELVDIMPTLLEATGVKVPENVQGKSLLSLLSGKTDLNYHKDYVVSEFNGALAGMPFQSHGSMVFDGRYKTCVYHDAGKVEIFDLEKDPGEFVSLWDAPDSESEKLRLIHRHLNAIMGTSDAGIERTGMY
ncbi:MAG: sulfatase-like hydrolase/transferase [Deltaproteobacteria bacterium]|jgi:arylsulfatase|nr:sulfatase-like hydrolase/transferase [Deltaproteobacteria bacterium]MBT6502206.1 sulfatase-like hydrolase/transferase [Deltaproteobacteria bacterium]MBT7151233.1 sulfatase-like hydrolase/transferase [Deltaproteobacteria bacterium]MBT7716653.1 sulfatase-like hydrolase/transferase [Deltaproteobacteria bacterium]MBT7891223.1 sulfatase-like hydrolase/transferase [Deltaproteobacteria bacterium]